MKRILLLIPMIGSFLSVLATDTDTCSFYTEQSIKQFYENCLVEIKYGNSGAAYIHHFFEVSDTLKQHTLVSWARSKGFATRQTELTLLFEKQFDHSEFKEFYGQMIEIWQMRQKLGLTECSGTGQGVGNQHWITAIE